MKKVINHNFWKVDNYEEKIKEIDSLLTTKKREYDLINADIQKLKSKRNQLIKSLEIQNQETRKCKSCEKILPITNFQKVALTGPNSRYRRHECTKCLNYGKLKDPKEYKKKKLLEEERKKLSKIGKKRCSVCEVIQSLDDFQNDFTGRVRENKKSYCKSCAKVMRKNYKERDPIRYAKLKSISDKKYFQTHKKERNEYNKKRYKNDEQYKLSLLLRGRLKKVLDRKNVPTRSEFGNMLGCSYEELVIHLESQFTDGMDWSNWSRDGWHIDHIKPLAAFDLTDKKQLAEACHYTNLQPLWAEDNYSKGDKLNWDNLH